MHDVGRLQSDLTYELGVLQHSEYLVAAAELLTKLIPGEILWNSVRIQAPPEVDLYSPNLDTVAIRRGLLELGDRNPVANFYLSNSSSKPDPIRLSDLLADLDLRRSPVFSSLVRPTGLKRQLTVLTLRGHELGVGRAWTSHRSSSDFTRNDVDLASSLRPILGLLEFTLSTRTPRQRNLDEGAEVGALGLSVRELEVMKLLAQGLSAHSIARLLRISPRTVHKHLENSYRKLYCHDRVTAMNRVRRLGFLELE